MASRLSIVRPPARASLARRLGARLAVARPARWWSRVVHWRLDPVLLRLTGGRVSSTLWFRSAVLETTGARSGLPRRHAVLYFHDGDDVVVIASHAGSPRHPAWFHNLRANPEVVIGGEPRRAVVVEDERDAARLAELGDRVFPAYARYRSEAATAGRTIPVVRLTAR